MNVSIVKILKEIYKRNPEALREAQKSIPIWYGWNEKDFVKKYLEYRRIDRKSRRIDLNLIPESGKKVLQFLYENDNEMFKKVRFVNSHHFAFLHFSTQIGMPSGSALEQSIAIDDNDPGIQSLNIKKEDYYAFALGHEYGHYRSFIKRPMLLVNDCKNYSKYVYMFSSEISYETSMEYRKIKSEAQADRFGLYVLNKSRDIKVDNYLINKINEMNWR